MNNMKSITFNNVQAEETVFYAANESIAQYG